MGSHTSKIVSAAPASPPPTSQVQEKKKLQQQLQQTQEQQEGKPRYWYRDNLLLTNDKSYLEPEVINEVFDSDLMWWNDPMEVHQMRKMLHNSMTFGVYAVQDTQADMEKNGPPKRQAGRSVKMVAFARLVTDYTTFAYLTDVFVVRDYQRRGLAKWMMRGIKDVVTEWPLLRGLLLMTDNETTAQMYKKELGCVDFDKGPSAGLVLLELEGNSCKSVPEGHLMV